MKGGPWGFSSVQLGPAHVAVFIIIISSLFYSLAARPPQARPGAALGPCCCEPPVYSVLQVDWCIMPSLLAVGGEEERLGEPAGYRYKEMG